MCGNYRPSIGKNSAESKPCPFESEKWSESHRKCSCLFFFWGGGVGGDWIPVKGDEFPAFLRQYLWMCVCVCLCKIRVSKSSRSSAIYPSNLSFFVELTKLVFGRPRKRFWVSRTSTKRWTFVEISSFPGCQVNGTDRPSTFGVDIWW